MKMLWVINVQFKRGLVSCQCVVVVTLFTGSIGRRVTIEKMWNELKADEQKRLQPVILHAEKLRSSASPSAKQCLEIYSKPTSIDRYTGKASKALFSNRGGKK